MSAFLLRFKEECNAAPGYTAGTGTETHTYVRNEEVDDDHAHHSFRILTNRIKPSESVLMPLSAETKTITEVGRESTDDDPTTNRFETFPRVPI